MHYHEIKPEKSLSHLVKCFWVFQSPHEDLHTTILPDGYFDLIININQNRAQKISLTGIWRNHKEIVVKKGECLFGIRFKLLAAEVLLQQSLHPLLNSSTPLPLNFWCIHTLNFNAPEEAAENLSTILRSKMINSPSIERKKLDLLRSIYNTPVSTVSDISQQLGWSERQINRYFNQLFGLSLKSFLDIVRCHAAYPEIAQGKLAPDGGYYDQSHFIKEVKKHTGVTPKALAKNPDVRFLQLSTLANPYL